MSQFIQRSRKSSRSPRFDYDRFMGWVTYGFCFFTVFYSFSYELVLLGFVFLTPKALIFWQGIIHFVLRVPPTGPFSPEPQEGFFIALLLLIDSGFIWFTYKFGKRAIVDFLDWKNFSYMRQLNLYHSTTRQLAFLYTLARFENERFQLMQLRKSGKIREEKPPSESVSFDGTIQRVGPFSWFYMFLFNYLLPPSATQERQAFFTYLRQFSSMIQHSAEANTEIVTHIASGSSIDGSEIASIVQGCSVEAPESSPLPPIDSSSDSDSSQGKTVLLGKETQRAGSIYVFAAQPAIFLGEDERVPVRIDNSRRLSLLIFLASYGRYHTIHSDDIINAIYEGDETEKSYKYTTEQLRTKFHKDVSKLRELFEDVALQANLPYCNPICVNGKGKQAVWSLSEKYEVVDVMALEQFFQQGLKVIQAHQDLPVEELRDLYKTAINYYQKGFLREFIRKKKVGDWAQTLRMTYQDMYRQIIWTVAEYEQELGLKRSLEEQNKCFQQAAWLYEKYARETTLDMLLEGEEIPLLSEVALQKSMDLYVKINKKHNAVRVYHEYGKAMMRRRKNWSPNRRTEQIMKDCEES